PFPTRRSSDLRAGTNYIKRMVGLPRERLRILNGDLLARKLGPDETELLQFLHDKREQLRALRKEGPGGSATMPDDERHDSKEAALRRVINEKEDELQRIVKAKESEYRILRKPPAVVLSMLREVYDNDHVVDWMTEAGWPARWQPCP